jgi:hypothetical protein
MVKDDELVPVEVELTEEQIAYIERRAGLGGDTSAALREMIDLGIKLARERPELLDPEPKEAREEPRRDP